MSASLSVSCRHSYRIETLCSMHFSAVPSPRLELPRKHLVLQCVMSWLRFSHIWLPDFFFTGTFPLLLDISHSQLYRQEASLLFSWTSVFSLWGYNLSLSRGYWGWGKRAVTAGGQAARQGGGLERCLRALTLTFELYRSGGSVTPRREPSPVPETLP